MPEVGEGCAGIILSNPPRPAQPGVTALDDPTATPPPPPEPGPDAAVGSPGPGATSGPEPTTTAPAATGREPTPRAGGTGSTGGTGSAGGSGSPPPPGPPPASGGGGRPKGPKTKPPGLKAQFVATRDAALRLLVAHVDLAKAEASQIGGQVAQAAALVAIAIVLAIGAITLLVLGTSLFLGEWLLGSMGWGIVNGMEASLAVAMTCVLIALGISAVRIIRALVVGIVVGLIVAIILWLNLPNHLYAAVREALGVAVDPASAPLIAGAVLVGLVGLIVGIVLAVRMRATAGTRVGAVIGLTLLGALLGAFTAITFNPQVAAGIGITVGYAVWMIAMGMDVAGTGIDTEALKLRFTPTQTIETSKETLEWLQRRMPPGIG